MTLIVPKPTKLPENNKLPIRGMIVAPPDHYLVNFDLAQAESWIVAYLADEPRMKHALNFGDFHRETAQNAFAEISDEVWEDFDKTEQKARRYTGKRYNHASAYRMGPNRAAEVINKDSDKPPYITVTVAESKVFYQQWHDYYHIQGWWSDIERQLNSTRTLKTPYGRIRYFFDQWGNELFKKATAFVPQSTVADHMNGMIQSINPVHGGVLEVKRQLHDKGALRIINQAHDSILCIVEKRIAKEVCEQAHQLLLRPLVVNGEEFTIPVDCEIGERWGRLEEQKREVGQHAISFSI